MTRLLRGDLDRFSHPLAPGHRPAPLVDRADHAAPSIFRPENLLREARRQKGLSSGKVAPVCVLDPDGDMVDYVRRHHAAKASAHWACYHTQMWEWTADGIRYGIVGHAVGSSFAVLVAEQLFASGCELLVSVASAGQITDVGRTPYYVLIDRALRDEGTSYHYLPAADYVAADTGIVARVSDAFKRIGCNVRTGATWTTDAPFRETAETINARRAAGILVVEMEAAALYAFAASCSRPVICLAHVSNQLGCVEGDFEKGHGNGACGSIELVTAAAKAWLVSPSVVANLTDAPELA
jgi:uridine phosphorylase